MLLIIWVEEVGQAGCVLAYRIRWRGLHSLLANPETYHPKQTHPTRIA